MREGGGSGQHIHSFDTVKPHQATKATKRTKKRKPRMHACEGAAYHFPSPLPCPAAFTAPTSYVSLAFTFVLLDSAKKKVKSKLASAHMCCSNRAHARHAHTQREREKQA